MCRWCFDICTNRKFEIFIIGCILVNMIALSFETVDQSARMELALDCINYFFVSVLALEVLLKLIAFNWRYFTRLWNIFDITVVIVSITGTCLHFIFNI